MINLIHAFAKFQDLEPELSSEIEKKLVFKSLKQNAVLLRRNQVCDSIYFIKKGTIRGVYKAEDTARTNWFAIEGDIVTSLKSFVQQTPSEEEIEVLEDVELYCLSYADLNSLYEDSKEMNVLGRKIIECYYVLLESRSYSLQYKSAKERYDEFIDRYPQLLQRIPLSYIASYLGITQPSLSRIRKKK